MVRLDQGKPNSAGGGAVGAAEVRSFKTWFLLPRSGQFKSSYHEFRTTDEFEGQVDRCCGGWLEEKHPQGRPVVWPIATKGSPFRGLAAFGSRTRPCFSAAGGDIARSVDTFKDAGERGRRLCS